MFIMCLIPIFTGRVGSPCFTCLLQSILIKQLRTRKVSIRCYPCSLRTMLSSIRNPGRWWRLQKETTNAALTVLQMVVIRYIFVPCLLQSLVRYHTASFIARMTSITPVIIALCSNTSVKDCIAFLYFFIYDLKQNSGLKGRYKT